ncbi:unnamed protein product [Nezara viridula]|uniref:Uncharacterized protein n=1 Tax=Nezara viridula TaxID=85310 RepID=A0A9P0E5Q7_NEZVI|nr:unnamed protein product [Nezara viridula]
MRDDQSWSHEGKLFGVGDQLEGQSELHPKVIQSRPVRGCSTAPLRSHSNRPSTSCSGGMRVTFPDGIAGPSSAPLQMEEAAWSDYSGLRGDIHLASLYQYHLKGHARRKNRDSLVPMKCRSTEFI